jgi:signal peptidase II
MDDWSETDRSRKTPMKPLLVIGSAVFVLDQITKLLVLAFLPEYSSYEVIPGFFNLVHARNPGAAFSFLAGQQAAWRHWFFVTVTAAALVLVFFFYRHPSTTRGQRYGLALIFGGALGNLVDRLRLGEVVDFLDFYVGPYHWPAFNVADSAITVGAGVLLAALLRPQPR